MSEYDYTHRPIIPGTSGGEPIIKKEPPSEPPPERAADSTSKKMGRVLASLGVGQIQMDPKLAASLTERIQRLKDGLRNGETIVFRIERDPNSEGGHRFDEVEDPMSLVSEHEDNLKHYVFRNQKHKEVAVLDSHPAVHDHKFLAALKKHFNLPQNHQIMVLNKNQFNELFAEIKFMFRDVKSQKATQGERPVAHVHGFTVTAPQTGSKENRRDSSEDAEKPVPAEESHAASTSPKAHAEKLAKKAVAKHSEEVGEHVQETHKEIPEKDRKNRARGKTQ